MPKVHEFKYEHEGKLNCHQYHITCPGCQTNHAMGAGIHGFNGDFEKPTFTPSLLCTGSKFESKGSDKVVPMQCHSFVRDGRIQFLSDCNHALAGQTVDLPEFVKDGLC